MTTVLTPPSNGLWPLTKITLPSGATVRPDKDGHVLVDNEADATFLRIEGWRVFGKLVPAASVSGQASLVELVEKLAAAVADAEAKEDELLKRRDLNGLKKFSPYGTGSRVGKLLAELRDRVNEIAEQPLPMGTSTVSPMFKNNVVKFDAHRLADRLGVNGFHLGGEK